jgi:hypothetical protein
MPASYGPIIETQIGAIAYVYGILSNGSPLSFQGLPSVEADSDDVSFTWLEKENADTQGNVQNLTQTNFKYERSLKVFPSGATRAAADACADGAFTLQNLTIANYAIPSFNGTWRIKPGIKVSLKMAENGSIDISAEKYANANQNTALTGPPIQG